MQENHSGPFSRGEPKFAYAVVNKEFLVVLGFFKFNLLYSATIQSKVDSCLVSWFNSAEGIIHNFLLLLAA